MRAWQNLSLMFWRQSKITSLTRNLSFRSSKNIYFPSTDMRFSFSSKRQEEMLDAQKPDSKMVLQEETVSQSIGTQTNQESSANRGIKKIKGEFTQNNSIYTHIFLRVLSSCRIYLQAPLEERERVNSESRFYYIKKEIDFLTQEEQREFDLYLERGQNLRSLKNNLRKPKTKNQTSPTNTTEIVQPKVYTCKLYRLTKKKILDYLEEDKKYGKILHKLILEFIDPYNPDLVWDIDPGKDEIAMGKVSIVTKIPKQKIVFLLRHHNQLTRKRYERLDLRILERKK